MASSIGQVGSAEGIALPDGRSVDDSARARAKALPTGRPMADLQFVIKELIYQQFLTRYQVSALLLSSCQTWLAQQFRCVLCCYLWLQTTACAQLFETVFLDELDLLLMLSELILLNMSVPSLCLLTARRRCSAGEQKPSSSLTCEFSSVIRSSKVSDGCIFSVCFSARGAQGLKCWPILTLRAVLRTKSGWSGCLMRIPLRGAVGYTDVSTSNEQATLSTLAQQAVAIALKANPSSFLTCSLSRPWCLGGRLRCWCWYRPPKR